MPTKLNYRKSEFLSVMEGRADEQVLSDAFDLVVEVYERDYRNAWACLRAREQKAELALKATGFTSVEALAAAWLERDRFLADIITSLDNHHVLTSPAA